MPRLSTPAVAVYMAKNKRELRGFFQMRAAVFKAFGNQAYVINPKRCLCPFFRNKKHSTCKSDSRATVDLNRLNDLSNLWKHLKKQHADNPLAVIAAQYVPVLKRLLLSRGSEPVARVSLRRRLEVAQGNQTIDAVDTPDKDSKLTQRAGGRFSVAMEMDETKGHEQIRGVREDDDSFDPEFEMGTPEMEAWVEKVTAEDEALEADDSDED